MEAYHKKRSRSSQRLDGSTRKITEKGGRESTDMSSNLSSTTENIYSGIKERKEAGNREEEIIVVTGNHDGIISELEKVRKLVTEFWEANVSQS